MSGIDDFMDFMKGTEPFVKYKGVSWSNKKNKWQAEITENGKKKHLGYFNDQLEAAEAYDREDKK